MNRPISKSGIRTVALLGFVFASGCALCPGGMFVRDGLTKDVAMRDGHACAPSQVPSHVSGRPNPNHLIDVQKDANRCMHERGYIFIPEALLLDTAP